jgi:RNA polymerase sigma-70 factor (ECF subfamily)
LNACSQDQASDEELARDARNGSLACFEELVRRYQVPLLRFLQRKSPRPEDAEDVLQETFLRAYQSLHKYNDQYRFKTWLFTIGYRLAVSAARAARPAVTLVDSGLSAKDNGPDSRALRRESHERLWELARRTLGDEQYAVLWLHYVEDASPRDIATVMGRSWVWVRTALHRSRKKMAEAMESPARAAQTAIEIKTKAIPQGEV